MTSRKRSRRKASDDEFDNDDNEDGGEHDDGGAKWACQSCTFINRAAAFRCGVCGSRKGTSTRRARLSGNVVEMQKTITDLVIKQVEKEKSLKRKEKSISCAPSTSNSTDMMEDIKPNLEKLLALTPSSSIDGDSKKDESFEISKVKIEKDSPICQPSFNLSFQSPIKNPEEDEDEIVNIEDEDEIEVSTVKVTTPVSSKLDGVIEPVMRATLSQPTAINEGASTSTSTEHVSPATSRQSSETDSSSDTMRSLEAPTDERLHQLTPKSTRIPDFLIRREIAQKIVVISNGVPAVFVEYPRRF